MLKSVSSITNAIGALNYKGTWNASTNTPTLASGVGTKGDYYVVSVAGSTALDGISNWGVGDLATFNGSVWQRVEGGADLNGVNLSVSGTTTLSGLTASTALALNASKEIVSVTNTGTGNNVLATAPTLVGDVTLSTGNTVISTSGKGVTTGSAIPLGLGVNNAVSAATIDTSSNFNIGQTTAISGAKATVNGQIATSPFFGINTSTATTVATGVSFLAIFRCRGSGGSAVVLYENGQTPVIIAQTGTVAFTTSAPGANEIQLADGSSSITALAGASVGVNNLNVTVIQNQ